MCTNLGSMDGGTQYSKSVECELIELHGVVYIPRKCVLPGQCRLNRGALIKTHTSVRVRTKKGVGVCALTFS